MDDKRQVVEGEAQAHPGTTWRRSGLRVQPRRPATGRDELRYEWLTIDIGDMAMNNDIGLIKADPNARGAGQSAASMGKTGSDLQQKAAADAVREAKQAAQEKRTTGRCGL